MPSVLDIGSLAKKINFNLERDPQKISYERLDYESVDEKSLYLKLCHENRRKKNSGINGLRNCMKKKPENERNFPSKV